MLIELLGGNESKPHRMSPDTENSGKPSRYPNGEGCHLTPSNHQTGARDTGGVSEDDTTGRVIKVSWEISGRGAATPQPPAQGGMASEAGRAARKVGVLHSSDDPAESQGRALGPMRFKAAMDWEMASGKWQHFSTG